MKNCLTRKTKNLEVVLPLLKNISSFSKTIPILYPQFLVKTHICKGVLLLIGFLTWVLTFIYVLHFLLRVTDSLM